MIREREPPKPSTRLQVMGPKATEIAQRRGVEPAGLSRLLRGDLDWIAMRALEKEPARRYETAEALAQDVRRYLDHEPVLAGPPTAAYRVRKFIRRHSTPLITAAAVLTALVVGLTLAIYGLVRAKEEQDKAREAEQDTEAAWGLAEQRRTQADETAGQLRATLVRADFSAANDLFEAGESREALAHLARALRNDPDYWPAGDAVDVRVDRA